MICKGRSPVAILGDPENVFLGYISRKEMPEFLDFFLRELIQNLLIAYLKPASKYCRLYLESKSNQSQAWHIACEKAVTDCDFTLYWTPESEPAEDRLARDALTFMHDPEAPLETFVISGDGDLIPTLDKLHRWNGIHAQSRVCSMGWREWYNPMLQTVATGTVYLDDLVPKTQALLNARKEARQIRTP